MSSHDLTDDQWAVIEPRIPKRQRTRGRPRTDDRRTLNGMVSVLPTGCAWADLPTEDVPQHLLATMARVVARRNVGALPRAPS